MNFVKLIRTSVLLSSLLLSSFLFAQNTGVISVSTDPQPREGKDFTVVVNSSNPAVTFGKVVFGYRLPNDEFVEKEMQFDKGSWKYIVTSDYSIPPRLEYYVIATLSDASEATYPTDNYRQNPAYFSVSPKGLTDAIAVLMGEEGTKVAPEDFMIMLSYYTISDQIDLGTVKLVINGKDVTTEASVTADALNYLPASTPKGKQSISFEAKLKDGTVVGPLNWNVSVVSKDEALAEEEAEKNYSFAGNVWDEYRYEKFASGTKSINRANVTMNGNVHWLTYNANVYKTSEESKFNQASDRYTLKLGSEYLDLTFGDAYPSYSRLMMNGSRVRGVEGNLKTNYINIDAAYGYLKRATEATFSNTVYMIKDPNDPINASISDSLTKLIQEIEGEEYIKISSAGGVLTYKKVSNGGGAFDRELLSVKVSFGSKKEGFNTGFGFLRSADDVESNKYGSNPTANLVLATDMQLRYDNGRFELYGDAAFSLNNSDVSSTNEEITKEIKKNIPGGDGTYNFIDNIIPISGGLSAPTSAEQIPKYMAFLAGLKLNYWNNYFKLEYLRNGSTYKSEGLPFFQNDIQGVKLTDRLRLWQNRVFLTFGYDLLTDNTSGDKDKKDSNGKLVYDGTTTRNNIRSGFAIFPGVGLPSFSFDFIRGTAKNEIPTNLIASSDYGANTFQLGSNYGFTAFSGYHTVGLSVAVTNKVDNRDEAIYLKQYGFSSADQTVRSIVLSYGTTIGKDLSANFSYNNSNSSYKEVVFLLADSLRGTSGYAKGKDAETSYNILEASLGKSFFDSKMKAQVRANATIGELNQYIFGTNAQYYFMSNLFSTADFNYILNEGEDADLLFTLRLQYVF
ncbi:MAG: hypothetical protein J0L62_15160 [Bacteroidetes bacterium]|nr:hypothetical protein [Bacteroidota bacterium]